MPFCPKCKAEYKPGSESCADCGVDLVERLPEIKAETPTAIVVWTDSVSAPKIQQELEAQGIPSHLEPVEMSLAATPMGLVRVRVPREQAKAAVTVLEYLRKKHPSMLLDYTGRSERPPILPGL